MKTLKFFFAGLTLLISQAVFSQVVQVDNNTSLSSGNATFVFSLPSPPPTCLYNPSVSFAANSTGNVNTTSCSGLTLSTVQITFHDLFNPCQPNPQAQINLSPSAPNAVYIDCPSGGGPGTPYYFTLVSAGSIWLVTIYN